MGFLISDHPDQTLDTSSLLEGLNWPFVHTPLKFKRGREVLHPVSTVSQAREKKMCVCVGEGGFKLRPAMELRLSQCGPRAAQELVFVGKNTKLQLVQEGLLERPPWSLTLAGGPDPAVETVHLKGCQGTVTRWAGDGRHWIDVAAPSGASGDEDLTALGVGRSLSAASRTGRGFQKQSSERAVQQ